MNLLLVGRRTVEVLRRHTIILDKSNCSNATSLPPPTSSPHSPSPPTSSPASSQTCQALRNLASSNRLCNTTHSCTTVECLVLNYHAAMTVLPCHTPPALRVVVHNATGGVLYNETLTQSRTIHEGFITLNVTVEHVSNKAIVVKVKVS